MIKQLTLIIICFCFALQATHPEQPQALAATIQFLLKFQDQPGTYKLKVEAIGQDEQRTALCPRGATLDKAGRLKIEITHNDLKNRDSYYDESFAEYYQVPRDAEWLRISIRALKDKQYKRGGWAMWRINKINQVDQNLEHKLQVIGIHFRDQFSKITTGDFSQAPICAQSVHL